MKSNKPNFKLDYPKTLNNSKIECVDLFNCFDCGFHGQVISKIWIKGFEDDFIIQLKDIRPEGTFVDMQIDKRKLKSDGEIVEEHICGKCSRPGIIQPVPKEILEMHGFDVKKDSSSHSNQDEDSVN